MTAVATFWWGLLAGAMLSHRGPAPDLAVAVLALNGVLYTIAAVLQRGLP
jgi:hypothetical protein